MHMIYMADHGKRMSGVFFSRQTGNAPISAQLVSFQVSSRLQFKVPIRLMFPS